MAYGVASKKIVTYYTCDDGSTKYTISRSADVIDAGNFEAGNGGGSPLPSKGRFRMRHVGLVDSTGLKRVHLPIADLATFTALAIGASLEYGGVDFSIVGKEGERTIERA